MEISKRELLAIRELQVLRDAVTGLSFDQAPDSFKDIESAKVRLNVIRNPEYYKRVAGKGGNA